MWLLAMTSKKATLLSSFAWVAHAVEENGAKCREAIRSRPVLEICAQPSTLGLTLPCVGKVR